MKLAAWNVCSNDQPAVDYLQQHDVDVAILSEVGQTAPSGVVEWYRFGSHDTKGLAIASFGPPVSDVSATEGRWSVRGRLDSGLGLLGIWSNPDKGRSSQSAYAKEVATAIEANIGFLAEQPCVIAGDFNLFSFAPSFKPILNRLRSLGYVSAHHHLTGEPLPGQRENPESEPTHLHQFNRDKPFHIDYLFVADSLLPTVSSFAIDSFANIETDRSQLLSDHAPLSLTVSGL